jgi:hypothetical protein
MLGHQEILRERALRLAVRGATTQGLIVCVCVFRAICAVSSTLRKKIPFSLVFYPEWPAPIPMQRPPAFSGEQAKDQLLLLWNWVRSVGKDLTIDWTEVDMCIKRLFNVALEARKTKRLLLNQKSV